MAEAETILVTGAAGFIGSHVVDRLVAGGHRVEAVDNLSAGSIKNLEDSRQTGSMRFHQLDVRAPEFVDLVARMSPSAIVHLAGHVDRPGSLLDPLYDADVNVLGTLNVLEAVRAHEVPKISVVVHGLFRREQASTGRVIVGQEPRTPSDIATGAVVDYTRVHGDVYGLDVRVVGLSNVYGPRQRVDANGPVIARFVDAAKRGVGAQLQGDGTQVRDFLFIDDAVDAIAKSLDVESGAIIAVGSGVTCSIGEVAEMVANATGSSAPAKVGPPRPFDRPGLGFPTEDAARRLGWSAWTSLKDGIAATCI